VATGTPMVPTTTLANTATTGAVQRRVLTMRGTTTSTSRTASSTGTTTIRGLGVPVGVPSTYKVYRLLTV